MFSTLFVDTSHSSSPVPFSFCLSIYRLLSLYQSFLRHYLILSLAYSFFISLSQSISSLLFLYLTFSFFLSVNFLSLTYKFSFSVFLFRTNFFFLCLFLSLSLLLFHSIWFSLFLYPNVCRLSSTSFLRLEPRCFQRLSASLLFSALRNVFVEVYRLVSMTTPTAMSIKNSGSVIRSSLVLSDSDRGCDNLTSKLFLSPASWLQSFVRLFAWSSPLVRRRPARTL